MAVYHRVNTRPTPPWVFRKGCDHLDGSKYTYANSSLQQSLQHLCASTEKVLCSGRTKGGVLEETDWISRAFEWVTISMCACLHVLWAAENGRKWNPLVTFHHRNVGVPEKKNYELVEDRDERREKRARGNPYQSLTSFLSDTDLTDIQRLHRSLVLSLVSWSWLS